VLAAILIYSPYLRGLFFQTEQQWTLLLACAAFLLVWWGKIRRQEVSVFGKPMDYFALALVVLYAVSAFGAASQRLAVAEVVKITLYFLVFWMVGQLGREERPGYILVASVYLAAVGVALAGVLVALGVVFIKDGFVGGRIYSTLQYPNALASYLTAANFFGWLLWARAGRIGRFLLAAGTSLLLTVLLGTGSRGGLLLYPAVLVVFLLGAPRGTRVPLLVHVAGSWATALMASSRFLPLILAGQQQAAWQWLVLSLLAAVAVQGVYEVVRWAASGRRRAWVWAPVGASAALAAVLVLRLAGRPAGGGLQNLLPAHLASRLQDISLETFGAATRLQWSLDALKLVQARPWLGWGGGAWEAAYQSFQSYYYTSTQVHNHYFQIWTEVGSLGLAVLAGLWVCFLVTVVANYRRGSDDERFLQWAVFCAALALGLHAMLDFDLALGAVSLVLWTCFGLTRGLDRKFGRENYFLRRQEYLRVRSRFLTGAVVVALLVAWLPASLLLGEAYARKAVAALQTGQPAAALENFRLATLFDPFRSTYLVDRASLLAAGGNVREALALAGKAVAKDRFNQRVLTRAAEVSWQAGRPDQAVEIMEKACRAAPWTREGWENLGRTAAMAGLSYLAAGERDQAKHYLERAAAIPSEVRSLTAGLSPELVRLWKEGGRPWLEVTPAMELTAGIAFYGLGRFEEALEVLARPLKDKQLQAEASYWASLTHRKLNHSAEADELRKKAEALNPELVQSYRELEEALTLSGMKEQHP